MKLRGVVTVAAGGLLYAALSLLSLPLLVVTIVALALIVIGVGALVTPPVMTVVRWHAGLRRRTDGDWFGVDIPRPYRPPPVLGGGVARLVQLTQWQVTDPATWRDLLWLLATGVVGFALGLASFLLTCLVVGIWLSPRLMLLSARLDQALLAPTRARTLEQRVEELGRSRAAAVDTSAAELQRIERDLHDGAQSRLVAMGMGLGEVERLLDSDPDLARVRLVEMRGQSVAALTELRQLVRGVHPPILADRGLVDALRALALDSPLPVVDHLALEGRLDPAIESAAYFAVAELLTNAAKHAHATCVAIDLRHAAGRLRISVTDDGVGGADASAGSGLGGLRRRFSVFDGELMVDSPEGGPTTISIVVPCRLLGEARQ